MAQTVIHGGMADINTTQLQFSSQMSNYALTNHLHSQYLTTAALSNHSHTNYQSTGLYLTTAQPVGVYLTTAALSNHSHSDYVNVSQAGDIYFVNTNGVSFGSIVSGNNTTITASVQAGTGSVNVGNNYFINSNGHSFSSSVNGNSTFHWILI